jgi:Undecaprenyl-phosphate glucose phosphotransferase
MPTAFAVKSEDISDGLGSLDAGVTSGSWAAPRHWAFASDARAALMVCLHSADILVVAAAGIISYLIRYGSFSIQPPYLAHIVIGCIIFSLIMQTAGMSRFAGMRHHREHLTRLSECWMGVILLLIAIIYLSKLADDFSRTWILLWAVSGWLGLVGTRLLVWRAMRWLRSRGQLVTRTAVVGHGAAAEHCATHLQRHDDDDVRVIGVFEPADVSLDVSKSNGRSDLGNLARLVSGLLVDEIVIALPCNELADPDALLGELSTFAVDIKLYIDFAAARQVGCQASPLVAVWERPLAGLPSVVKRGMDICLSAMALILTLPLMGLIAALVKLDSRGPVFFRQQRFGFSKKPFTLYKFRSMQCDAGDDPLVPQARRNDPRVTRVGRLLRRTSLDELPQLYNMLKGDMSLVGPRPHPTPLDDKFAAVINRYLARHHVKPGITGWAQVNGLRGETDTLDKMERRVEHDLFYIDHWSPLLDLRILCKTLVVVVSQRNAY